MNRVVFDIETTGLLDSKTIDYSSYPFKLKPTFRVHCIVFKYIDTGVRLKLYGESLTKEAVEEALSSATEIIAHSGIKYDLPVLRLFFGLEYHVGLDDSDVDTVMGKPCKITDTVVMSRTLWPDRLGGHSLKAWGKRLGILKGDFAGEGEQVWEEFSPEMLSYCEQDTEVTEAVFRQLLIEKSDWPWDEALNLEQAAEELAFRQEHFGFKFFADKAQVALTDLNEKMQAIEDYVEPLLPEKPMSKTNAKPYLIPKIQIKKDGSLSAIMKKFIDTHKGTCTEDEYGIYKVTFNSKGGEMSFILPTEQALIRDTEPMLLPNQRDMKEYLVGLGWNPLIWGDNDLSVNQKKQKLDDEKYKTSVIRYCRETAESTFKPHRLSHLRCKTVMEMYQKLMSANRDRPVKVISSPKYTINADKELCPNLERLGDKVSFVKDVVYWLTYRHRRNSILSPNGSGFLAQERISIDGRIQTPVIACGASTTRMQHKVVANIPRPTSLYGAPMRDLFGVEKDTYQIGCDASGLEARVEGHYTRPYEGGEDYIMKLMGEKPNDIHTATAAAMGIIRDDAKTLKYSCLPVDSTTILTKSGWKSYSQLSVGEDVLTYNTSTGFNEWSPIKNIFYYPNVDVVSMCQRSFKFESTGDHRWFGSIRRSPKKSPRYYENLFKTTDEINTEFKIKNSAEYVGGDSHVSVDEAKLVAWILSNGYLKWAKDTGRTSSQFGNRRGVSCRVSQDESKYVKEIEEVLESVGAKFTVRVSKNNTGFKTFILSPYWFREFWAKVGLPQQDKHDIDYLGWICSLKKESLGGFVESFWQADGWTKGRGKYISQNEGNVYEAILLACYLVGYSPKVSWGLTVNSLTVNSLTVNKRQASITLSKKQSRTCQKMIKSLTRDTDVFCIETANSTFVARQGDIITITGNCSYGAQPPKIAKQMDWPINKAQQAFEDFWEAAYPLKLLKAKLGIYWKGAGGSKLIKAIDGRKLMSRSEHSLLNLLFQSCGSIIMKRAAIIVDRWLAKEGYLFDPFTDSSFYGKAMFMIQYHDEYQLQVCKSLVTVVEFDDESQAKSYEGDGTRVSDLSHVGDKFWAGTSKVGEKMSLAIKEAAEYYGLRVPFDGDYQIGKSWLHCH